ncbi:MAG: right-handed parallel beta-helix repeat-containing protein [Armatimonadetes bacterium]|nr:right-handed parallel beta-helix repeat-containing protein [Armatimonadota bacterium]
MRVYTWLTALALGFAAAPLALPPLSAQQAGGAAPGTDAPGATTVIPTPDSPTGGIQEAIDRLPPGGGAVFVPGGTYLLHRPVILRPGVKLTGAGKATVLRKDAGILEPLAADARKGDEYVTVKDASRLREGMAVAIGDRQHPANIWSGLFLVNRIEGTRLYVTHLGGGGLRYDVSVADEACLMNLFMLIKPAAGCLIADMELDGNDGEQMVAEALRYGWPYGMLWCGVYPCNQVKITNCWVHNCGIGIHVNGSDVEISHCLVYDNRADGIHCGGGPGSFISHNRVYGNKAAGISFCFGNRGLIISENRIYDNLAGIYALGNGDPANDTTADRFTIICNNVIERNRQGGLQSGQGPIGPQDFVFSGNIVKDNNRSGDRGTGPHRVPAGISLYNAKRCVITGNRCLDTQDAFPRALRAEAAAGSTSLSLTSDIAHLFQGGDVVTVSREGAPPETHHLAAVSGADLALAEKLESGFTAGATVRGVKSQQWGIFVGGPEAEGNVVTGNVCTGNAIGGILWQGKSTTVSGNVGETVAMDGRRSLAENVFSPRWRRSGRR